MPMRRLKRKISSKRSCANAGHVGKERSFLQEGHTEWDLERSVLATFRLVDWQSDANASYL